MFDGVDTLMFDVILDDNNKQDGFTNDEAHDASKNIKTDCGGEGDKQWQNN